MPEGQLDGSAKAFYHGSQVSNQSFAIKDLMMIVGNRSAPAFTLFFVIFWNKQTSSSFNCFKCPKSGTASYLLHNLHNSCFQKPDRTCTCRTFVVGSWGLSDTDQGPHIHLTHLPTEVNFVRTHHHHHHHHTV